ncbi:MAG TPA: 7-cyano-7-deazaguanine synthase QueC [Thermoanaerobaculia bacterium]|nr:7-cyano-7-deazaguanine synthase QueC [Thermoanaerobaculia bacterium]
MASSCILLLSGGLDSATCLLIARREGLEVHALSFDYGQRHAIELECAREIARRYGAASHRIARLDLAAPSASVLTDPNQAVPRDALGDTSIPATYVPARNTVFLAHALAWAEAIGARDLMLGANALDYSGYPDCRPEFLEAFERMANLATKAGVEGERFRVRAPLLALSKAQIVSLGAELGLDFSITTSCYDPSDDGRPCGACDSCLLRGKGFREAGIADPRSGVRP